MSICWLFIVQNWAYNAEIGDLAMESRLPRHPPPRILRIGCFFGSFPVQKNFFASTLLYSLKRVLVSALSKSWPPGGGVWDVLCGVDEKFSGMSFTCDE